MFTPSVVSMMLHSVVPEERPPGPVGPGLEELPALYTTSDFILRLARHERRRPVVPAIPVICRVTMPFKADYWFKGTEHVVATRSETQRFTGVVFPSIC
jgi:hypothetical protein